MSDKIEKLLALVEKTIPKTYSASSVREKLRLLTLRNAAVVKHWTVKGAKSRNSSDISEPEADSDDEKKYNSLPEKGDLL